MQDLVKKRNPKGKSKEVRTVGDGEERLRKPARTEDRKGTSPGETKTELTRL